MDRVGEEVRPSDNRSTGPMTEAGKARSSRNALKHGLRAKKFVMCDENPDAFQEYRIELMIELAPLGTLETALADHIAKTIWRLNRCMGIEAEMFDHERSRFGGALRTLGEVFAQPQFGGPRGVALMSRYETSLQRMLTSSIRSLREKQKERNAENPFRSEEGTWATATQMLMGTERGAAESQNGDLTLEVPTRDGDERPNERSSSHSPGAEQEPDSAPEQSTTRRIAKISKRTPPPPVEGEARWPGPAPAMNAGPVSFDRLRTGSDRPLLL
jgi:hypothetical protein